MPQTSLTDRLPSSWECGSWGAALKENVSKYRAPRATQLLIWVSCWSLRQLGYFQTTFHAKFLFQMECWNSQSVVNSKLLLLFYFRIFSLGQTSCRRGSRISSQLQIKIFKRKDYISQECPCGMNPDIRSDEKLVHVRACEDYAFW